MFKDGFYTALGTPVDEAGNILEMSLCHHIEDQIDAGASGLLLLGSMGIQPCIRDREYARAVRIAVDATAGRCPLFLGVMDNSMGRVRERIEAASGAKLEGVVVTTPYYFTATPAELQSYFTGIAGISGYPVYLYDLPGVTKTKINLDTILALMSEKNISGIKTGDLILVRDLKNHSGIREDFSVFFSGIELFDVAYAYGIRYNLDGMFSCTPRNAAAMYRCFAAGDIPGGSRHLDMIMSLRRIFMETGVFPAFTTAMNLLGYQGIFNPDYGRLNAPETIEKITAKMKEIGEL